MQGRFRLALVLGSLAGLAVAVTTGVWELGILATPVLVWVLLGGGTDYAGAEPGAAANGDGGSGGDGVHCVSCGRLLDDGGDRCEPCSTVGSWRK